MITFNELEAIAYANGDTVTAALYARIAELESKVETLEEQVDDAVSESLARWEDNNGPADTYKAFFEDCYMRLNGHYPAPSITSDYDKSVIFAAIHKGEGGTE